MALWHDCRRASKAKRSWASWWLLRLSLVRWRDLALRSDDQVRGNKKLWWFVVTINRGNLIAYWLFGRR
jgi:hypothetical protein